MADLDQTPDVQPAAGASPDAGTPPGTPPATPPAPTQPTPDTTPQPGAAGAPAPAGPDASALPRGRATGVHGILAHITLGALSGLGQAVAKTAPAARTGLERVGQAVGRRVSNLAKNSLEYREMQKDAIARQEAQQQMAQEQTKSLDAHQTALLQQHLASMQILNEGARMQSDTMDLNAKIAAQDSDFYSMVPEAAKQSGAVSSPMRIPDHTNPHDDLNVPTLSGAEGKAIGSGQSLLLPTGDPKLPVATMNTDWAKSTMLDQDAQLVTKWKIDPKTGEAVPDGPAQTIPKGSESYYNLYLQRVASTKQMHQAREEFDAQKKSETEATTARTAAALEPLAVPAKKAEIAEKEAQAAKAKSEAQMAGMGDTSKTGEEYIATLPPAKQDLVRGGLAYQIAPKDLGRGKDREAVIAGIIHADPNKGTPKSWSMAKYEERFNFMKEWGSTSRGAGAAKDRLNLAVGHLDMLSNASQALMQNNLAVLNNIAQNVGTQIGWDAKTVYNSIALKAAAEAANAMQPGGQQAREGEIEKQFKQFNADLAPNIRTNQIKAQYGLLQTQAGVLDNHFQSVMGTTPDEIGQGILSPQNAKLMQKWTGAEGAAGTRQVPPHKWTAKDKAGNVIGYADDDKGTNLVKF